MYAFAAMVPRRTYARVASRAIARVLAWIAKVTSERLVAIKRKQVESATRATMQQKRKRRQSGKSTYARVQDALNRTAANITGDVEDLLKRTQVSQGIADPATSNGNVPVA